MKLTPGVRLGPHEIVAPIGAGGMGEVYRARDTRLDRSVAIKILPAEFAQDAKFKIRFEREAKAISALNHPHICALYDVGPDYLVLEHCEGKTLAQRIADGALPPPQVLEYGIQIADALDKAHRHGIVHRDLKPANIIITKSGVKLLDFGLAKERDSSSPERSTVERVTEDGTLLGTIQYMAPEVLAGKPADARSDIFALGLVLYEMASGTPAFSASNRATLIAALLEHEPPSVSPPALDRVIRACLIKDPDERMQTAHDVLFELRWIAESNATPQIARPRLRWLPWSAAALACLIAAGVSWQVLSRKASAETPRTLSILLPEDAPLFDIYNGGVDSFATSPDNRYLVYAAATGAYGRRQLYRRDLKAGTAEPIPGTEDGIEPFFSPDGQWIGFITGADRKLRKIPVGGGISSTICDAGNIRGATWGADDVIVLGTALSSMMRVSAAGGVPQPLNVLHGRWPTFLPDGEHVLFTGGSNEEFGIEILSLKTGEHHVVLREATYARYTSGHLLFARGESVFATPFDPSRGVVSGTAVAVLRDVESVTSSGIAHVVPSPDGSIFYVPRNTDMANRRLVWADRSGKITPLAPEVKYYQNVRISPNGTALLARVMDPPLSSNWLYDIPRESWRRLSFEGEKRSQTPSWSPDGKQIMFSSNKSGLMDLYTMPADGSAAPRQITKREHSASSPDWSRTGTVVYSEQDPATGYDLWTFTVNSPAPPRVFAAGKYNERWASISPNGRWIAYDANESRRYEVYVQEYPGPGKRIAISSEGGTEPRWNPRGNELFFRNGNKLMVCDVKTEQTLIAGKPRLLFEVPFQSFDVAPDGQRFALVQYVKTPSPPRQINVLLGALSPEK